MKQTGLVRESFVEPPSTKEMQYLTVEEKSTERKGGDDLPFVYEQSEEIKELFNKSNYLATNLSKFRSNMTDTLSSSATKLLSPQTQKTSLVVSPRIKSARRTAQRNLLITKINTEPL